MFADDDVSRFDVAMEHAAAVGVVDGVADVHQAAEQLAQFERSSAGVTRRVSRVFEAHRLGGALEGLPVGLAPLDPPFITGVEAVDGLLEGVAADEPHGVIGTAVGVGPQPVDRDDTGMFQPSGHFGLEQEPLAADRVVGMLIEDLFERDLAVELGVEGDVNGPQAATGMRPQHAEPLAAAGVRVHGVTSRGTADSARGRVGD